MKSWAITAILRRTQRSDFASVRAFPALPSTILAQRRSFGWVTARLSPKQQIVEENPDVEEVVVKKPRKARAASTTKKVNAPKKVAAPKKKVVKKATVKKEKTTRVKLPKRVASTWMLYYGEQVPAVKAALGEGQKFSAANAAAEIAERYRNLSANEKDDLASRLEDVKAQYKIDLDAALAQLTPEQVIAENKARRARRAAGTSHKRNLIDPNKPKRPLTPFFIYLDSKRSDANWAEEAKREAHDSKEVDHNGVQTLSPSMIEFQGISRKAGAEWRAMSEAEKEPYLKMGQEAVQNYKDAIEAYKKEGSS